MLKYASTRAKSEALSFDEAIFQGLAPDGGLYLPEPFPPYNPKLKDELLATDSFAKVAEKIISPLISGSVIEEGLLELLEEAFHFELPLRLLDEKQGLYVLELFHGPTFAFKDVGARFMARAFSKIIRQRSERILILAATSGDTGSAVAQGFLGVPNIDVCILYPKGGVSHLQEQQITTNGHNVHAIEVEGRFDDCQALVKKALRTYKCPEGFHLSTANSINISRLIPQATYYAWAYNQAGGALNYIVPSGNFGNITSGILARQLGMPAKSFTAAVNANDVFPSYLQSGKYEPKQSLSTLSNAMDVGAPSNFERLLHLFNNRNDEMNANISSLSVSDQQTKEAIKEVYEKYDYVMCPHTATAYHNYKWLRNNGKAEGKTAILATAHPAKFGESVFNAINKEVEIPEKLAVCLTKEKKATSISANYEAFASIIDDIIK